MIVGRELLWTMQALVSEKGYSATDAKRLLSLVQFVLNHRERNVLGGRTPIQVMTGQAPTTAMQLVMWEGHLLKEAKYHTVELEQVESYCQKLAAALDIMHQEISDAEELRRWGKAAKQVDAADRAMNFEVGDLFMVCDSVGKRSPCEAITQAMTNLARTVRGGTSNFSYDLWGSVTGSAG